MPARGRIAYVSARFPEGSTVGGAETLLRQQAERLAARGYEVTFLATCATNHVTWENALPAGAQRVGDLDVVLFPVDQDRDVPEFLRAQQAISRGRWSTEHEQAWFQHNAHSRALCEHLERHAGTYDRIVAGPYLFGVVMRAAAVCPEKTLLVPCLHDEPFARTGPVRSMVASVQGFMFNTKPERDLAQRMYGLEDGRCSVVGTGMQPFDSDAERFRTAQGITAPYIIYCGRREAGKGTPLLLDYLAAFRARTGRDIKLVLTGSGPVDVPPELAEHVIDTGVLSERDKRSAMAGALAFCHPSVNESLGIVLLESWLAKTPVLVHALSPVLLDQCRRSGGGLWFARYPEFEEELLMLADDPDLGERMARSGREFVLREYSWRKVEEALVRAVECA